MEIKKVGVVGCGLMGAGIAQVAAQAGYTTIVREVNEEFLEKGLGHISAFLDKGVAKKKMTQDRRDVTWANIRGTTDLTDLADCDLIIEAIYEDLAAKQELFKELDDLLSAWEVVFKEKHVSYLWGAAEKLSMEAWMDSYNKAGGGYSQEAWRARYENKANEFQYAHLYFLLRKP